jgi:hypothetical protein
MPLTTPSFITNFKLPAFMSQSLVPRQYVILIVSVIDRWFVAQLTSHVLLATWTICASAALLMPISWLATFMSMSSSIVAHGWH